MPRILPYYCTILLTAFIAGCGGEALTDPAMSVTGVKVAAPRTALVPGSTLQLSADPVNAAGTILVGKTVVWVSSRPDVATITSLGLVTGVATGSTTITATSEGQSGNVVLTVQAPNLITLTSDAGDYIGQGRSYSYSNANAMLSVSASASRITVGVAGNQRWSATFAAPFGTQLRTGTFAPVKRWPFNDNDAGLSWSGEGRGCNTLTGSFTVDSLIWDSAPGVLLLGVDMRFTQHCEGGGAALRGTIHWRADDVSAPSGPASMPANLWQPPPGVVPAVGNVTYLQSDQGDYIGQGETSLYQSNITASSNGRLATVTAGGYQGNFAGMNAVSELKVGYYGGLIRYPFHNAIVGGLNWSGNGRGCNMLTGWFAVDRVNYVNGTLAGIELRFQQHCEGMGPALRGMVRWGQFTN